MELTTSIVSALIAGANAAATNLATQSIQEIYHALKTVTLQHFQSGTSIKRIIAQLEADPAAVAHHHTLTAELGAAGTSRSGMTAEAELARLSTMLLELIAAEEKLTDIATLRTDKRQADRWQNNNAGQFVVKAPHAVENDYGPHTDRQLRPGALRKQASAIDPYLQRKAAPLIVAKEVGAPPATDIDSTESANAQVDLVGELRDAEIAVPGLQIVRQVGTLFTATAFVHDVAAITAHPNLATIQLARPLSPTLAVSLPALNCTPAQLRAVLPAGTDVPNGQNVIVGIIDYGCDFAHGNFRQADGKTRILALWHQAGPFIAGISPDGFAQGREFDAETINRALETDDPYATLGYDPGVASHGTHVMDIACGNGRATGNPGVAPGADIIFVHIDGDNGGQKHTYGNARNLMEATDYIFQKATTLGRPAVINISLGTHSGPHDGTTPVERWFDQLLQSPNRAIVVSAGNSWRHRSHAMGVATLETSALLPWIVRPGDPTDNEVEIWYAGVHSLTVTLVGPDGMEVATIPRGHTQRLFDNTGKEVITIIHNELVASNGDHQINIWLDKALAPTGTEPTIWQIILRTESAVAVPFHAWIERNDTEHNTPSFFHPSVVSTSHTLSSISCGEFTIAVGSYIAGDSDKGISAFSSAGPTRDGKAKPEVSAPGQHVTTPPEDVGILAAESRTNGATRKAGTSMAAPHITGLIALLIQSAKEPLCIDQIRTRLFDTMCGNPSTVSTWHPQYGFRQVNAGVVLALKNK